VRRGCAGDDPAMVLLSVAAGFVQAGVLDQSLFAERYGEVRGWEESFRATAIAPLGVSAHMLQSFIVGHVVYSLAIRPLWPSMRTTS
jgi:hypothetical protein